MLNMFKKQSMRVRLLSLIFISFTLAIAGLGTGVVVIQKNLLNQMDASVAQLLKENDTQMNTQFTTLGKEITNSLDQIPESVGSQIVNKTTDALNKEKDIVSADFENSLKMSMESLAVILAKVAPAAILSNDFTTLISYVKSASSGKDVIYAIYLRPDGRPLTRYYDRQNPKIKEFIETSTEKRKINKVLQASKNDPSVMIVQKTIELDGTVLGSVILCASKETMGEKLKAMDHRFSNLIKSNDLETANALNQESKKIIEHFSSKLNNISQSNSHSVQKVGEQIQKSISDIRNQIRWLIIVLGAVSIIIISIILFFVISKITKKINIIAKTINTGSAEVAEASEHVSRSSQTLAEASTEQASAIEETSASMEEMSSMTKTNANNANQADTLMKNTGQTIGKANESMSQLIKSMEDISRASDETSKIVKTIDEIAFQTNLLALNAAVEAARAGEAGAGFAVVADEVRNLAMRAAKAAKDTTNLIEDTVSKINSGSTLVNSTNEEFTEVASATEKVAQLIDEISSASSEQADGIEQINQALVEMDNVTQQNAAISEESASASEEMNAQSVTMIESVEELVSMVQGSKTKHTNIKKENSSKTTISQKIKGVMNKKKMLSHSDAEVRPDQVIPFDDSDKTLDF